MAKNNGQKSEKKVMKVDELTARKIVLTDGAGRPRLKLEAAADGNNTSVCFYNKEGLEIFDFGIFNTSPITSEKEEKNQFYLHLKDDKKRDYLQIYTHNTREGRTIELSIPDSATLKKTTYHQIMNGHKPIKMTLNKQVPGAVIANIQSMLSGYGFRLNLKDITVPTAKAN